MKMYFALIVLCAACYTACVAQTEVFYNSEKYSLCHYTDENGLPQNSIKNIAADSQGFIWMATEEGLVRFDGQKFYTFNKSILPIPANSFFTLRPRMDIPRMEERGKGMGGREKGGKGEGRKGGTEEVGLLPWVRLEAGVDNHHAFVIENGTVVMDPVYFKKVFPINKKTWYEPAHIATSSSFTGKYTESKINSSPYYIPLTSGEGSFFKCTSDKVSFYSNWKQQYEVSFKNSDRLNFFTENNKLYYFEDNGKLTEIAKNSVTAASLAGDILHDPKYAAGKKNFNTYWSNANSQTFIYLGKNLYQLHEGKQGEMSTKLVFEDFDLDNLDISNIYYNEKQSRFFLGSASKGLYVLTIKPFQVINSGKNLPDNVFYAQTPFDSSSVLTPKGLIFGHDK